MKPKRIGAMILMIVLCAALQVGFANADPLNTMVFNDGRKLTAPEIPVGQELMVAEPWEGSGLSIEELVDQGLIIKSYPDVEALLAKKPVTSGVGIETIIDWDTRMRTYTLDYPARAVVLVDFDQGRCTGWLVGSDTVVTAGHCVHSGGALGDWYTGHVVYPGYDQTVAPYGSCTSAWLGSVLGWTVNQKETYDYGVVKLNCDVGNTTGWFGFLWRSGDTALLNYPTAITGYPGDKPLEQWQSNDKVRASALRQIFYQNDTVGGMSGSPIWFDKVGPYGIGIHTYGLHGSGNHSNKNHGTRITKGVFNNLLFWINEPKQ